MVHIIGWQLGDSTHLKVIYSELFIWLKKSSARGGNSLSSPALGCPLHHQAWKIQIPQGNLWTSESWSVVGRAEEGIGAAGTYFPNPLLEDIGFSLSSVVSLSLLRGDHGSSFTSLPPSSLPASLFSAFFISFYKHLLSLSSWVLCQSGNGRFWCSNKHPWNFSGIQSQGICKSTCHHRPAPGSAVCDLRVGAQDGGPPLLPHTHLLKLLKRPLRIEACCF